VVVNRYGKLIADQPITSTYQKIAAFRHETTALMTLEGIVKNDFVVISS
jgi:hypothetical protein